MKKFLSKFTTGSDKVSFFFAYISMAMVMIMMVIITVDVICAKLRVPLPGMYEVCQVMLSTVVFTSWAYTQSLHGHIHVVMFISKFPQKLRFICFGVTSLLSAVTMGFGTYSVFKDIFTRMNSGEVTGTLLIPYWPFIIFEAVAFLLMTILLLRDAIKAIISIWDKEMAEDVQKSWV